MFTTKRVGGFVAAGALSLATLASTAGPAMAAHNGNNRAEITGAADLDATGRAIVNYSEGQGTFNGSITVSNLDPGATYSFFVRRGAAGVDMPICTDTASSQGVFTCSEQQLALGGFTMAVVRDSAGAEVANGTFARRGNCRDADQAMSQCDAPGRNK